MDENGVWLYHDNISPTEHGFWVEAKDLLVGDVFLGANGELSTLTNIVRVEQEGGIAVFNFEVEGNNNYFILAKEYEYGQTCVLVHNGLCKPHNHHIVMKGAFSHWGPEARKPIIQAQELLRDCGIDVVTDKKNLVKALNTGHTKEYAQKVWDNLEAAVKEAQKKPTPRYKDIQKAIHNSLDDMANKIKNGGLGEL